MEACVKQSKVSSLVTGVLNEFANLTPEEQNEFVTKLRDGFKEIRLGMISNADARTKEAEEHADYLKKTFETNF